MQLEHLLGLKVLPWSSEKLKTKMANSSKILRWMAFVVKVWFSTVSIFLKECKIGLDYSVQILLHLPQTGQYDEEWWLSHPLHQPQSSGVCCRQYVRHQREPRGETTERDGTRTPEPLGECTLNTYCDLSPFRSRLLHFFTFWKFFIYFRI